MSKYAIKSQFVTRFRTFKEKWLTKEMGWHSTVIWDGRTPMVALFDTEAEAEFIMAGLPSDVNYYILKFEETCPYE